MVCAFPWRSGLVSGAVCYLCTDVVGHLRSRRPLGDVVSYAIGHTVISADADDQPLHSTLASHSLQSLMSIWENVKGVMYQTHVPIHWDDIIEDPGDQLLCHLYQASVSLVLIANCQCDMI